jgi:hypothetical protein
MYSGFLVLAYALWRAAGRHMDIRFLCLLVLMSIVVFSPVGHNNHWYSMQILYQLTNTFLIAAFVIICLAPDRWTNNILSALACWAASYGTANGLPGFMCCAIIAQVAAARPLKVSRLSVFWLANTALLLTLYLPGLPASDVPRHPSLPEMLRFSFVYIGLPLRGLVHYPYSSMFQVPEPTRFAELIGLAVCALAASLAWILREHFRCKSLNSLLFISFSLFAVASSILTAWGRATLPPLGIAWANSSRYSMYAAYLPYGILFLLASDPKLQSSASTDGRLRRIAKRIAPVLFVGAVYLAAKSYWNSLPVYHDAHEFNRRLEAAFADPQDTNDDIIYPSREVAAQLKRDLRVLGLGPYRYARDEADPILLTLSRHRLEDEFGVDGLREIPGLGQVVFAIPHSRFALPAEQLKRVRFEFGITDTALRASPQPDGVIFCLLLKRPNGSEEVLWTRTLRPISQPEDRGVQSAEIVLNPGHGDQLVFETRAVKNPASNWAFWRSIVVLK